MENRGIEDPPSQLNGKFFNFFFETATQYTIIKVTFVGATFIQVTYTPPLRTTLDLRSVIFLVRFLSSVFLIN